MSLSGWIYVIPHLVPRSSDFVPFDWSFIPFSTLNQGSAFPKEAFKEAGVLEQEKTDRVGLPTQR